MFSSPCWSSYSKSFWVVGASTTLTHIHSNWASMMSNKNTVLVRHLDTPNPNMLICWLNYLIRNITHWLQSIFWDSFAVSQLHVGIQKTLALPNNLVDVHPTLVRACSVVAWLICPQLGFLFNWTQAKSQDSWQGHLRIIINHLPWHTKILEYSRKQIHIQVFIPCSHTPLTKLDFSLRDPGTELV